MKIIPAILTLGFLAAGAVNVNTFQVIVVLKKNSSITIEGTSNITKFRFSQNYENFIDRCLPIVVTQNGNKLSLGKDELLIPVKGFNSKNKMALRDFYKLMDTDNHPEIRIQLHYIELQSKDAELEANVVVDFTIAGTTKGYAIPVKVLRDGDDYIFSMDMEIDILDFGLTPPSHLLQMVKVSEWININMDVTCKIIM